MAFIACLPCYAQDSNVGGSPTTLEEFNYAVNGYKDHMDKGQDVKAGYVVEELGGVQIYGNLRYQFRVLIRKQNNEVAGILVTAKDTFIRQTYFTCIPINNKELLKRYHDDLSKWSPAMILKYAQITSPAFGSYIAMSYQR